MIHFDIVAGIVDIFANDVSKDKDQVYCIFIVKKLLISVILSHVL